MPDRFPDSPPPTHGAIHPRRSQHEHARRFALLEASLVRWLEEAGWPHSGASAQARILVPTLRQELDEMPANRWFDRLPALVERIAVQCTRPNPLTAAAFLGAFARSMVAAAIEDVAREARRAGHASVFAVLRPYLLDEPSSMQLAELGAALDLSRAALAIALSRLRHRFRERIEAALALWAANPETRNTLRRQLRESLVGQESIP